MAAGEVGIVTGFNRGRSVWVTNDRQSHLALLGASSEVGPLFTPIDCRENYDDIIAK